MSVTTAATATTAGARAHARAQAGTITDSMPVVPASRWPNPPAGVAADLTWAETVRAAGTPPRCSHAAHDYACGT